MRNLDLLIPRQSDEKNDWLWATVATTNPLTVRLDGDDDPLELTPVNLAGKLSVGNRVWAQMAGKRVVILGLNGGPPAGADGISAPTGAVLPFAGSVPPDGWLICDGRAVSRTTYAALFSVISTIFGAGDGSTTFNLPNLSGRTPIGVGTATGVAGATAHPLGQLGGEETHKLTIAETPSHEHGHPLGVTGGAANNPGNNINAQYTNGGSAVTGWTGQINGGGNNVRGGDGAHNNMQPFIGLNYIINTLQASTVGSSSLPGDSGWLNLPLASGITNGGTGWPPAQYRKIGSQVFVRGLINHASAWSSGTSYTIGTLPVGFRPPAGMSHMFATVGNNNGMRMDVYDTGQIAIVPNLNLGTNDFASITCSFLTD